MTLAQARRPKVASWSPAIQRKTCRALTQAEPMAKFVDRQDCREFSGKSLTCRALAHGEGYQEQARHQQGR